MSDLIDRDETIKQFCKQDCDCDPKDCPDKTCYEVEIIESVPTHTTPSNTLGALDCVSREDLTKGIEAYFDDLPIAVHYDMLALAQSLPSVQPRKGNISYTKFCEELWGQSSICSLCGCSWQIAEDGDDNFCPNCGCRMEEGD